MDYRTVLNEIYSVGKVMEGLGNVATYIPELSNVDPDKFGIYLLTLDRQGYGIGDDKERFSIQSISKIFTVSMAIRILGESVWKRVGVEPSGSPFNSMVQLEYEKGYPRNPLINPVHW